MITIQKVNNTVLPSIGVNTTIIPTQNSTNGKTIEREVSQSNNTSHFRDIELILEASRNHKVKGGHGITDYLPGIRANRYGFVY